MPYLQSGARIAPDPAPYNMQQPDQRCPRSAITHHGDTGRGS